jgi:glycosyltransferase involved in cell wall biosynthesis
MLPDLSGLRVCFIAGTLGQGGAERQLYYMLKTLCEQEAIVHVLSLSQGEFWEEKIRTLGIPVAWVGQSDAKLVRLFRILTALRDNPPDVLQSQHFYTNFYTAIAARLIGVPSVGAVRNLLTQEIRKIGYLGNAALYLPRLIAANSWIAIEEAQRLGVSKDKLYYLPNVVDLERFGAMNCTKSRAEHVKVTAVGRLVRQKRMDRFLEVIAALRGQTKVPIRGEIVGDGPERVALEQYADRLNLLPETVMFRGQLSDMAPVYRKTDILLLTSDWEGTPNVVLEAMASGLPVVATDVGDICKIMQHGITGYVVRPQDVEYLVSAVLALIEEPELRVRMGSAARDHAVANYSLERLECHLHELYDLALSSSRGNLD